MWVCGELGLKVKFIEKKRTFVGLEDPEALALNPNGRAPALVEDDLVIWESAWNRDLVGSQPNYPGARGSIVGLAFGDLRPSFKPVYDALIRTSSEKRDNQSLALGLRG